MCPVKYYVKQFNLKLRPAQESGTVTDTGKVSQLSSICVTGECTGNCGHPQKAKWQGGTVVVGNYNLFLHNIAFFFFYFLFPLHSLILSCCLRHAHIHEHTPVHQRVFVFLTKHVVCINRRKSKAFLYSSVPVGSES